MITVTGVGYLERYRFGDAMVCFAPSSHEKGDPPPCLGLAAKIDPAVEVADDVPVTVTGRIALYEQPVIEVFEARPLEGSGPVLKPDDTTHDALAEVAQVVMEQSGEGLLGDALDRWTAELNGDAPELRGAALGEGPFDTRLFEAGMVPLGYGVAPDGVLQLSIAFWSPGMLERLDRLVPDDVAIRVRAWLQAA